MTNSKPNSVQAFPASFFSTRRVFDFLLSLSFPPGICKKAAIYSSDFRIIDIYISGPRVFDHYRSFFLPEQQSYDLRHMFVAPLVVWARTSLSGKKEGTLHALFCFPVPCLHVPVQATNHNYINSATPTKSTVLLGPRNPEEYYIPEGSH